MKNYFGSVGMEFENGARLDLRIKMAIKFLEAGIFPFQAECSAPHLVDAEFREVGELPPVPATMTIHGQAAAAIDLACALIEIAEERGLIADIPLHDELDDAMRCQIRRNVRANVYQQLAVGKIGAEETSHQIQTVPPGSRVAQ